MSITDELREYVADKEQFYITSSAAKCLLNIADRIDAEHEKATLELNNLAEVCVLLPKDADGEYIRIGDVLTDDAEFKSEGKVIRLMLEDDGWMVGFGCGGWTALSIHEWHHHHAPTVEDVLWEFLMRCETLVLGGYKDIPQETFNEYAAKLRLADDGEEQ